MHKIGNHSEITGTSENNCLSCSFDGFKIVLNEKIKSLNGKNEGLYSNQGHNCHTGTALQVFNPCGLFVHSFVANLYEI